MSTQKHEDDIGAYLEQIGKTPLLNREEEIALGKMIKTGGVEGMKARKKLAESNLRLAFSVAKKYMGRSPSFAFWDLIQEANKGLVKATKTYDWQRGIRFSTYASTIMYREISRALKTKKIKEWDNSIRLWPEVFEDFECLINDVKIWGQMDNPFDSALLEKALQRLPLQKQHVITLRFALKGGEPLTLREIGEILSLTKERVRQLEKKALDFLRKRLENSEMDS